MAWILHMSHRLALERARQHGVEPADREPPREVRVAMESFTRLQRESLLLSYYEGRTIHEIAHQLDIPDDAVAAQIRIGLLKLQAETQK
jgi:DNA-directed RNA polymerase specialized sigma24 family protein